MDTGDFGKIVAITDRHLCEGDFIARIERLCKMGIKEMILREKDLSSDEYRELAKRVLELTDTYGVSLQLHTHIEVCESLEHRRIHLPMELFRKNIGDIRKKGYEAVGVSTHTVEEAEEAEREGATYITASHIYETDCKKNLPPRGLKYLRNVCQSVNIPVYALGGIQFENMREPVEAGARKVCMMSKVMLL